ncbi:hypothetical protein [Actinomycetospora flava]|uniref:Uncharacterized protein n=1 Tax=Actinomycetospora flava TaxID=3129232 RepID=A0ABU8M5Z3_9PSEU
MSAEVGSQTMSLLVADDLEDEAIVLEYRSRRADVKPLFVLVVPEDPTRPRLVMTFGDMTVTRFRELLAHASSQNVVESVGGIDSDDEMSFYLHDSSDPTRRPGLEWRGESGNALVTVWQPFGQGDPELWIRVWQEAPPRAVEKMVEEARTCLTTRS